MWSLIHFWALLYIYVGGSAPVSQQQCTQVGSEDLKGPGGKTWRVKCVSVYVCIYVHGDYIWVIWCMNVYVWHLSVRIYLLKHFVFWCVNRKSHFDQLHQRYVFGCRRETASPVSSAALSTASGLLPKHLFPDINTWPSSLSGGIRMASDS